MPESSTLDISFDRGYSGTTIARIREQQPPWKVIRSFQAHSGEALLHIHNISGGILDSDSLFWRVDVKSGAQAQLTTTGATRVYRSRSAQHTARQRAKISVGEGAYLEYLPDQLIPFAGSRFEQTTSIDLQKQASLIWWERIAPGREASGEVFGYQSLISRLELKAGGMPIAIEQWALAPHSRPIDSLARLGPFRHFGSCYVCRTGEPENYWRDFEKYMQEVASSLSNPNILWGVTCLRAHGLAIRGVSSSGRLLAESWAEIWKAAKMRLCGRAAVLPRKVH